jgi:hypothetical protein
MTKSQDSSVKKQVWINFDRNIFLIVLFQNIHLELFNLEINYMTSQYFYIFAPFLGDTGNSSFNERKIQGI